MKIEQRTSLTNFHRISLTPVKVTGNVKNGFTAEFVPIEVGIHMILVEYNGVAVGGTPYYSKAYDSESVGVSDIPKSAAGKTVTFAGKSTNIYIYFNKVVLEG